MGFLQSLKISNTLGLPSRKKKKKANANFDASQTANYPALWEKACAWYNRFLCFVYFLCLTNSVFFVSLIMQIHWIVLQRHGPSLYHIEYG